MHFFESFFAYARLRGGSGIVRRWDSGTMGEKEGGRMRRWGGGRMAAWEHGRMRGQDAGGKKKDGARKKTKPYTTIPSRGFAPGKLPLDRPHQGAAML